MLADLDRMPTRQSFVGTDRAAARPFLVGPGLTSL
jgi:hypothetical protein